VAFRILAGLVFVLGVAAILISNHVSGQGKFAIQEGTSIPEDTYACLQSGDLILRAGYGLFSNGIMAMLDEPRSVSHLGILVNEAGSWQVLHTLSGSVSSVDGLRLESLPLFLKESRPGALLVVRPKAGNAQDLICEAKKLMEAGIPFDEKFDLSDQSAFYCAEFVCYAMEKAGYPLWLPDTFPNGKPYLSFTHLYDERFVDIVFDGAGD